MEMGNEKRYKFLSILFFIVWIGSLWFSIYSLSSLSSSAITAWPAPFLLLAPIIPLWLALLFGRKAFSNKQITTITSILLILLFAYPTFGLIAAFLSEETSLTIAFARIIFLGINIYLALHAVFSLLFLLLSKKRESLLKASVWSLAVHMIIIGAILYNFYQMQHGFDAHFCSNENSAGGFYSQVHFLDPLTKEEVVRIVKENNIKIEAMTMAKKSNIEQGFRFPFYWDSRGDTRLNAETIELDLKSQSHWVVPFDQFPTEQQDRFLPLFDAYENNEPVVWTIEFADMGMVDMALFVDKLRKEKRLGVNYSGNALETAVNITDIEPPSLSKPIQQLKCLPE